MFHLTTPELFVDNQAKKRSGHMGHALVEVAPDEILDFYSNCDYDRCEGHSGYGWMEYVRSTDGGQTWGEPQILPYSMALYQEGKHTALCEKAVCVNGVVCCLFQITDASEEISCEPWFYPTAVLSFDGGRTWGEPFVVCEVNGRIYDALAHDGKIQFLIEDSEHFPGSKPENCYKLYVSEDNGAHFALQSVLPFDAIGKGYGAMEYMADGKLIAYVYDSVDESQMPYCISADGGNTWSEVQSTRFAQFARNPQIVRTESGWFLHARNGGSGDGLVLYTSPDGIHWDEGIMVDKRPVNGTAYYSNNLYLPRHHRVLVQYSHVYDSNRVNIKHFWIENV